MYLGRKTRASGSNRVKRGGSWNNDGTNLRSAKRNNNTPSNRNNNLGFRVGFRCWFEWNGFFTKLSLETRLGPASSKNDLASQNPIVG
jgi:hypothetical protein